MGSSFSCMLHIQFYFVLHSIDFNVCTSAHIKCFIRKYHVLISRYGQVIVYWFWNQAIKLQLIGVYRMITQAYKINCSLIDTQVYKLGHVG